MENSFLKKINYFINRISDRNITFLKHDLISKVDGLNSTNSKLSEKIADL